MAARKHTSLKVRNKRSIDSEKTDNATIDPLLPCVPMLVSRCPNDGVEHSLLDTRECEVCYTPLQYYCKTHTTWLTEKYCSQCTRNLQDELDRASALNPANALDAGKALTAVLLSYLDLYGSQASLPLPITNIIAEWRSTFLKHASAQRRARDAIELYQLILRILPSDKDVVVACANLEAELPLIKKAVAAHIACGSFSEAIAQLQTAQERFGNDKELSQLLEESKIWQEKIRKAVQELERSRNSKSFCHMYSVLTEVSKWRSQINQYDYCLAESTQAINDAEELCRRAKQHIGVGRFSSGLGAYDEALLGCSDCAAAQIGKATVTRILRRVLLIKRVAYPVAALFAFILTGLWIHIRKETADWTRARALAQQAESNCERAIVAYQEYLNAHPTGKHASVASNLVYSVLPKQIHDRIHDREWQQAANWSHPAEDQLEMGVSALNTYLSKYPTLHKSKEAREMLDRCLSRIEVRDWTRTIKALEVGTTNSIDLCNLFLEKYPNSQFTRAATSLRDKAIERMRRAQAYEAALLDARLYLAKGQYQQAREFCDVALTAKPNDPIAKNVLYDVLAESKRAKDYENAYSEAQSRLLQQRWSTAMDAVNRALTAKPDDVAALALKQTIQDTEALFLYQEAMTNAMALAELRDWPHAALACNKALKYKTDDSAAKELLRKIQKVIQEEAERNRFLLNCKFSQVVFEVLQAQPFTTQQFNNIISQNYRGHKFRYKGIVERVVENDSLVIFQKSGEWPYNYTVEATFLGPDKKNLPKSGETLAIVGELQGIKFNMLAYLQSGRSADPKWESKYGVLSVVTLKVLSTVKNEESEANPPAQVLQGTVSPIR